jgi:hypothetical protein
MALRDESIISSNLQNVMSRELGTTGSGVVAHGFGGERLKTAKLD